MQVANNIFVHDPETKIVRIDPARLHAHGWIDEAVQPEGQRSQQPSDDAPTEASPTTKY